MGQNHMNVTIKDIARILNVSHTTVSRALNDSPLINIDTKKLIQDTAKQLNYVPNYSAKSLVQNKSYNIGLFFSTMSESTSPSFFYETVKGVNRVIAENYHLVVSGIDNYIDFRTIDSKRFDGIIFMSQSENDNPSIYHAMAKKIPFVVLNREVSDNAIVNILSADRKGAYQAVTHLIDSGHVDIAIIEGEGIFHATQERREGFLNALIDNRLPINGEFIVKGNYTMESGYHAMKKLLKLEHRPTAVFSLNDEMAVGAMKAISQAGLTVPNDISIIGFDDSEFSSFVTPSLTTVRRLISEVATIGATKLLSMIKNKEYIGEKIYVKTMFIERDSVKNLQKGASGGDLPPIE